MKTYRAAASRLCLPGALLLLIGSSPCLAEDVTLRWKFKKGEELRFVLEQSMDITMTGGPIDLSMTHNTKMNIKWKVRKVEDGTAFVDQTISRVVMTMEGAPVGTMKFDSDDDTIPDHPMAQMIVGPMKAMVGPEFKLQIDRRGEISKITIPEEVRRAMKRPGAAAGFGGFTDKTFEQMFKFSAPFPKEPMSRDHTWTHEEKIEMPFGTMDVLSTYTYKGLQKKGARKLYRLNMETTTKIVQDGAKSTVFKMNIKEQKSSGYMLFDGEAGRLVHSVMNQRLVMEITVGGRKMQQQMKMALTFKEVSDKNAATDKKK